MTQMGEFQQDFADEMKALAPAENFPVAPAHGIAAIALNMALKYHDMQMIPDGLTYQQYKMEGRNMKTIGLEDVFDTAIKMEAFLMGASDRIAKIVVDIVKDAVIEVKDDEPQKDEGSAPISDAIP